ncbi:MAG: DNA-processing protein DprA [Tepidanaerobacteraceae bacterium]|nr:DNA-processing protein DprA [Tepidanaerobacteraceae bacterium]
MEDSKLLIALNMIPMLGSKRIIDIASIFKDSSGFLKATSEDLMQIPGISNKLCEHILKYRERVDPYAEIVRAKKAGAIIVTVLDIDYPVLLSQIYDPPPVLYVLGDPAILKYNAVAIVGTRKASSYGKKVAEIFAKDLASMEINVVSGMARGIDSYAHKGAIDAGGPTTAVLGCGIDIVYPPENINIMKNIVQCGCIITSFPMGTRPLSNNFPARNRIISGLSLGTLVVEAAEKSGSLITADFALEQGREVFAIPGSIMSPYSRGAHRLIKQGAKLVEDVNDILDELHLKNTIIHKRAPTENTFGASLNDDEKTVLNLLDFHPVHIEQLLVQSEKTSGEINSIITRLELKGLISSLPGGYIMKI